LELTREQRAAAEACGCAFVAATDEQVRRLTVQRRIFGLDGMPFLATRDGAYFETHATLAALIGRHAAVSAKRGAATEGARPHDRAAASAPEPAAASGPGPAQASPPAADPPTPAVDPSPTPESWSPASEVDATEPEAPPRDGAAVSAADAGEEAATPVEETGAEGDGAPTRIPAERAPRQRRAGQPKTPRWVTAGKERRGRLK